MSTNATDRLPDQEQFIQSSTMAKGDWLARLKTQLRHLEVELDFWKRQYTERPDDYVERAMVQRIDEIHVVQAKIRLISNPETIVAPFSPIPHP